MNYGIVLKLTGKLLLLEALVMVLPLGISLVYGQKDAVAFIISIACTALFGFILSRFSNKKTQIKIRDSLAIVSLVWILYSLFGSLPFLFSGSINSLVDAFFETVSGFTTTGSTILTDIESLPKGILFWRSLTIWLGGMGILVFTVAVFPALGMGGFQIFKAESPGPTTEKIAPKIQDTARILYTTYFGITLLEIILLLLGGMNLFDALIHSFGTVGTGGYSNRNLSIGAYNSTYINLVIAVFMVLSGINFSLYYSLFKGRWKDILQNSELRLYLGIIAVSVILIAVDINQHVFRNIFKSLEQSFFQVGSIISTTGYSTVDFDKWSTFSKGILFTLMFVGGCAGSTSGSIKNIRILVIFKMIGREFKKTIHPKAVVPIKVGTRTLPQDTVASISSFVMLFIIIFVIGTLLVSLEGVDLVTAATATAATLGNIGPGLGMVGPSCNFAFFSSGTKLILSALMLLGRLELFTLILLFSRRTWTDEV